MAKNQNMTVKSEAEISKYVKQCEQCKEFKNFKDVKFFPAVNEIETFKDGSKIHQQIGDRFYCNDCMSTWDQAWNGYSYEEWSDCQPIKVEVLI